MPRIDLNDTTATLVAQEEIIAVRDAHSITTEDFEKASVALQKANVPGPVTVIVNTDHWTSEQWKLYEMMEEMAGMPKEPMGTRNPGEKCKYETWNEVVDENFSE